jgi:hypothetical protein
MVQYRTGGPSWACTKRVFKMYLVLNKGMSYLMWNLLIHEPELLFFDSDLPRDGLSMS